MPQDALTQEEWDALGDTKVNLPSPEIPAPASKVPYDFENTETHGFPAEHNLHPEAEVLPEEEGASTQVFNTENVKPLKEAARQQARRRMTDAEAQANMRKAYGGVTNPDVPDTETDLGEMAEHPSSMPKSEIAPSKSIEQLAQEDAERILGKKPMAPPKVGELADAPVKPTTIKVPDTALGPASSPGVPGKTMTPQGVVEDAVGKTVRPNAGPTTPARMVAEDLGLGPKAKVVPTMTAEDIGGYSVSLAEKAAAAEARRAAQGATLRAIGKGALAFGKDAVKPITDLYTVPRAALAGWEEAGSLARTGKLIRAGIGLGKGVVKGGLEAGLGLVDEGLLKANYNKLTYGTQSGDANDPMRNKGLLGAQAQYFANKQEYNRVASKYGMRVTGSDPSIMQMLNPFFDEDPNLQVHEDPALKAAYQKRNAQRIQEMQEQNAVNPNVRANANQ